MKLIKKILFGSFETNSRVGDAALLFARVAFGAFMFIGHGLGKLDSSKFDGLVSATAGMGFPLPTLFAGAAIAAETVVAICLALGLFTRCSGAILAFNMGVAAFIMHGPHAWFGASPSKEMALLYFVPYLMFTIIGGGRYSLDRCIVLTTAGRQTV